jgi:hypothetical protein
LAHETEVRILYPKLFIDFIRVFRRWLYGLVLEASVREFESRRPNQKSFYADVAQLAEALVLGTRGCEFESHRRYKFFMSKWRNGRRRAKLSLSFVRT